MVLIERLATNPSVVARRLGEETVLVHLATNRIYNLNATATRLWELTRAGHTPEQICARLTCEFDVDAATLEREVEGTLRDLVDHGLLTRA